MDGRVHPSWPDRETRTVAPTLWQAVEALAHHETRGFTFVDVTGVEHFYSFQAIHAEAVRRGTHLRHRGLTKGDRLAIVIAEGDDFVLSFLGAVSAGIVPVPIYPRLTFKNADGYLDTVCHIATAAGARAILTTQTTRPHLAGAEERCKSLREVIDVAALAGEPAPLPPVALEPADVVFIQFTSGSTSLPKGVVVTHENLARNCAAFMYEGLDANPAFDKGVTWLPLFHDMGLIGFVMGPLFTDIPVVFIPTQSFAKSPRVWLETAHRHRGTITYAPNFGYALATKRLKPRDLEGLDLSCLRIAGCGAEPIQSVTLQAFAEKLAPTGFRPEFLLPSYGMAEATLAISFVHHQAAPRADRVDPDELRLGRAVEKDTGAEIVSCGRTFSGHEVRIIDDEGRTLSERQVGQIITRGPSVCREYHGNPEATRESFRDGWLHTGDLGYLSGGELYVCGRIKDVIIIRGRNHYPQDIEWTVGKIEGVRRDNVVAFGLPIEGEERLVVVAEAPRSQRARLLTEIPARILDEIGLTVHHVELVRPGALPKTSSGKPQRRKTKTLFQAGALAETDDSKDDEEGAGAVSATL